MLALTHVPLLGVRGPLSHGKHHILILLPFEPTSNRRALIIKEDGDVGVRFYIYYVHIFHVYTS